MRLALPALLVLLAAPAAAQSPCGDDACSPGACFEERGAGVCLCDEGFSAVGLRCVQDGADAVPVLPARHRPGVGDRAVSIAEDQLGRRRWEVRHGDDALTDYLAAEEWWCGDFVSWVYARAGVPFDGGAMGGWLVTNNHAIQRWFEERELWVPRREMGDYVPQPGDFVRFPTERGGHAAIVVRATASTLHTVEGNVSGVVERGRYYHYRDNPLIAGFGRLALDNAPPEVDPGADLEARVGRPVTLTGEVTDDGPLDQVAITWEADPEVRVAHRTRPRTEVSFARPGAFVLTLAADDGEHTTRASVTVRVRRDDPPRVVLSRSESGPLFATVEARVDDEDTPALSWRLISGPGEAELETPEGAVTDAHFTERGRYVLAFHADDGNHVTERQLVLDVEGGGLGCSVGGGPKAGGWLGLLLLAWLGRFVRHRRRG